MAGAPGKSGKPKVGKTDGNRLRYFTLEVLLMLLYDIDLSD